jgi:hypothetical protein
MRIKRWTRVAGCLWLVLLMALPSGIVCAADAELNELAPMVKAGEGSRCRDLLKRRLLQQSAAKPEELKEALKRLLKDPTYSRTLARYQFFAECDETKLQPLLKDLDGSALACKLLEDQEWLESFLCSGGLYGDGHEAFAVLLELYKHDQIGFSRPLYRKLATATALSFGAGSARKSLKERNATPVARYGHFKKAHAAGRLHKMFDALEPWEMRYCTSALTDDASMPWLLNNVNIPLERYVDACWMCEYRGATPFGGWVQAKGFYVPWENAVGASESTFLHGGVCGALSYFGTAAAAAHGIPSMQMGQPGHCAYGVRFGRGDWRGGFGGPYGGSHQNTLDRISGHTDIVFLGEEIFADFGRLVLSRRCAWQAKLYAPAERVSAKVAYSLGLQVQSKNIMTWRDAITWLKDGPLQPAAEYEAFAALMGKSLAKHPYVAMELLKDLEKPYLDATKPAGAKETEKTRLATLWAPVFMNAGEADGWYGWQSPHTWNEAFGRLGKDTKARIQFLNMLVASAQNSSKLLAAIVGWSQESLKDPAEQAGLLSAIGRTLSSKPGGADPKEMRELYQKLALMAETTGSLPAFQGISRAGAAFWDKDDQGKMTEKPPAGLASFPGVLLSEGGLLKLSSTSGWDRPLLHAAVLVPSLGFFHTGGGANPWAEVTLPKLGEPSGIIIVPVGGNSSRHVPMQVSVSEDGKQWTAVWKTDKIEPFWRIDLAGRRLRVKYVKVERTGDNADVFHLRGILVYGRLLQ